jgi:catalase
MHIHDLKDLTFPIPPRGRDAPAIGNGKRRTNFILREKITPFDHERIPEGIVHARGSAAHGYFQPYRSMKHVTKAGFSSDPPFHAPVFARFSTVAGGSGSVDLPRDVRADSQ